MHLEEIGLLDMENQIHRVALFLVFQSRIQKSLDRTTASWNAHKIRTAGNRTPIAIYELSRETAIREGYWTGDPGDDIDNVDDFYGYDDGAGIVPPAAEAAGDPIAPRSDHFATDDEAHRAGIFVNNDDEIHEAKEILSDLDLTADDGNWGIDTFCEAILRLSAHPALHRLLQRFRRPLPSPVSISPGALVDPAASTPSSMPTRHAQVAVRLPAAIRIAHTIVCTNECRARVFVKAPGGLKAVEELVITIKDPHVIGLDVRPPANVVAKSNLEESIKISSLRRRRSLTISRPGSSTPSHSQLQLEAAAYDPAARNRLAGGHRYHHPPACSSPLSPCPHHLNPTSNRRDAPPAPPAIQSMDGRAAVSTIPSRRRHRRLRPSMLVDIAGLVVRLTAGAGAGGTGDRVRGAGCERGSKEPRRRRTYPTRTPSSDDADSGLDCPVVPPPPIARHRRPSSRGLGS
ncbi:hypothetical protein GALMADRAFT_162466 [Galerina marginata CBS 339.88]|uniref:Integrase core domain-containing protein n=1 Tax=Galerina marginata (strain CBS 339.88) TaxID=685588 RepID=A0A067S5K6_GALM3|nr:hypothetical protein GALMADRAFT_162466 [Galerina marginata CBS 339.88]